MSGPARRIVIDHVALRVAHLPASLQFYTAALRPLGFDLLTSTETSASFGGPGADDFGLHASDFPSANVHVAFVAADRAAVSAFYAAALENGGKMDSPPGLCPEYHSGYYAAFVRDPDGNVIEAVFHNRP